MACLLVAIDAVIAIWALYSTKPVPAGVVRWLVPLAAMPWPVDTDRALFIILAIVALAAAVIAAARVRIAPILLGVVGAATLILLAAGAVKTANATNGHLLGMEFDARAAFGSLVLTLIGLLVVAGAIGVSRQTTTIAGLVALGLSLVIGILGPATSDYAVLHRAISFDSTPSQSAGSCLDAGCNDSGSASPGYSYGNDNGGGGSNSSGQASSNGISALFPTGASWASCTSGTPVATVETHNYKIVICSDGSSGYTYNSVRLDDDSTLSLPATYAQNVFTATNTDGTSYIVSPTELRVYDPSHNLLQVDAVTNAVGSTSGGAAPPTVDIVAELENLIETSHDGRAAVISLSNDLTGPACIDAGSASDRINSVESNRSQMLDAGRNLQSEASGASSGVQNAVNLFVTSMQDSLSADQALAAWIGSTYSDYQGNGCDGSVTTHGDPNYDQFLDASSAASTDKSNLATAFNPLAAAEGLKSDWSGTDI